MPFPGGVEATANAALLISAAAAFLYAMMLPRSPSWRRTAAKTVAVGMLAVLAVAEQGPTLLVAALALSALGDAFLAQDGERPFLAGLASFLAAHVAYVALFWLAGDGLAALFPEAWRIGLALAMAVFSAVVLARLWPALPGGMRVPVAVYVAAILGMGASSLTLAVPLAILGAVAFMASDAILATERFLLTAGSPQRRWTGQAVWWLYWGAQVAITLAFLLR